ncbi:MAG: bifunctional hydroxymethylpyrimidine kinase/phosphomethylpyrimidine kinase [Bacteroidales bacterium]|nr:bifunctional hydroxymethylpyrimidine kinase/phosphomethylpyrimidine kinase [Bacteroidales bacterium]
MQTKSPILTITGSDSTGGSGIQADIKTISELGGYAVSAITSITVQTTLGIQEFFDVPANIIAGQIEAIFNDVQPKIIKIGMIRNHTIIPIICDAIRKNQPQYTIYAPVVHSATGEALMNKQVLDCIQKELIPLCNLIIVKKEDANILHSGDFTDKLHIIDDSPLHGYANKFSSAIAVFLGKGATPEKAIESAQAYLNTQIVHSPNLAGRCNELYNEFINAIAKYGKNYSDVQFYAEQLNVSSRYLSQVTKRISGMAPKTIIDNYIIKEIETELKTTGKSIQEIANDFGFSSQAHFTKFFKKMKNISPREFRKTSIKQ